MSGRRPPRGCDSSAPIPFLELRRESEELEAELVDAMRSVIRSGRFIAGSEVDALESELSERLEAPHVIGTGSGTQALQVLLLAHGIGPGDEVITSPATYYATAKAIELVGARSVFADVSSTDFNLDPAAVEASITSRTRALVVVHLYGRPVDLPALSEIARRHRLLLLGDCAQAFGARVDGKAVEAWGDGAALSFYPTKVLGALGDAGACTLHDAELAERARAISFLGSAERDHFQKMGVLARMDETQAAALRVKLRHVDRRLEQRRQQTARYRDSLPAELVIPPPPPSVEEALYLFVIRTPLRDRLAASLGERGIQTQIHYRIPAHRQPLFAPTPWDLPAADSWARTVLSLPMNAWLQSAEQDRIIQEVLSFIEGAQ